MSEQRNALIKLVLIFAVLGIANIATPVLGNYLSHNEQDILFLGAVFLGGAIHAVKIRKQLNVFIKNWPTTLIYTAVILYGCKILAEKVINARTGIEVENIRYASTIGGFLYSVPLSIVFISWFMYAKMAMRVFTDDATVQTGKLILLNVLKFCFITSLFALGMYTFPKADAVMTYTVLSDASKITTCGPVEDDVLYVRKNSDACKRIHVIPLKGIYESTDVPSKSG